MDQTTIVLADDHHVVREGLKSLLNSNPKFAVVGDVADGLQALGLVERVKPDVLIVDLMMPGLGGLEVLRQVNARTPSTRTIVLSMHANEAYVLEALHHGAVGYVLKDSSAVDLIQAVQDVIAGRRYLSPPLSERAIEAYISKTADTTDDPYESLTTREREVLQLAAQGYHNTDIGVRLSISTRTAETHRANIMRKLNLQSQTDLIRYAIRRGIILLDP